ncbi:MAG: hypothetical protein IJK50_03755 [Prevotella sp.]|nr:hypothetical protein [Prevotella sp.]
MQLSFVRKIASKIGMDKAIAYSSGARIVQAVASLGTLFFIAGNLSDAEQGYYYTFGSIIAIQVFFELGLTSIITQYVAHESIHVTFDENGIAGEHKYQSRLASLLRFCVKWYTVISLVLFFVLIFVGFVFFSRYEDKTSTVSWRYPWIILSIATALKLFQSPLTSYMMGVGKVKEMNAMMFYQQLSLPLITWGCLMFGLKLYALGLSVLVSCLVWLIFIGHKDISIILKKMWEVQLEERVGYMSEIFPMQWRIALSWISGYFIFQLFNPVLFATEGAVVAGQMGMTLQILNGIQAFSYSWISTKIPLMSGLIEMRQYRDLDSNFNVFFKQMIIVCVFLILFMYLFFVILWTTNLGFNGESLSTRFLGFFPLSLLTICMILSVIVNAWATYLRCHKKEPFLVNSITSGVLCCISTILLGNSFGLYGIVIGYTSICVGMFPWGYWIFKSKKREWHQ